IHPCVMLRHQDNVAEAHSKEEAAVQDLVPFQVHVQQGQAIQQVLEEALVPVVQQGQAVQQVLKETLVLLQECVQQEPDLTVLDHLHCSHDPPTALEDFASFG
ncbi:hypothetical protein C0993_011353, partial [Termitomyces sp. T159_Od127]